MKEETTGLGGRLDPQDEDKGVKDYCKVGGAHRERSSRKCKCEKQLGGGLQTMKPLLHLTWMPPLWDGAECCQLLQFFLRTVLTASVTTLWASSLTSLQAILHNVLRCQSDLLKQQPKYVASLLKILKCFPMEDVFFKLLFLVTKLFLQTQI